LRATSTASRRLIGIPPGTAFSRGPLCRSRRLVWPPARVIFREEPVFFFLEAFGSSSERNRGVLSGGVRFLFREPSRFSFGRCLLHGPGRNPNSPGGHRNVGTPLFVSMNIGVSAGRRRAHTEFPQALPIRSSFPGRFPAEGPGRLRPRCDGAMPPASARVARFSRPGPGGTFLPPRSGRDLSGIFRVQPVSAKAAADLGQRRFARRGHFGSAAAKRRPRVACRDAHRPRRNFGSRRSPGTVTVPGGNPSLPARRAFRTRGVAVKFFDKCTGSGILEKTDRRRRAGHVPVGARKRCRRAGMPLPEPGVLLRILPEPSGSILIPQGKSGSVRLNP
jgi:hypothetical protein